MNKILYDDVLTVAKNIPEELYGGKILITGATGLLGSILVKGICELNRQIQNKITVFANCRNQQKYEAVFSEYTNEFLIPVIGDIVSVDFSSFDFDYVIHTASITDSKTFVDSPVETIETAIYGTNNLFKACVHKNIKSFIYLSSLEVYGTFNTDDVKNIYETDYGFIDHLNVRSSYSEGKRMVECLCRSYSAEYNVPVVIARLSQTFGPGIQYNDNRVFAQFARAVIEKKDIILKTKGETVRNYCYTTDAISALFCLLVKGKKGEAYNIANKKTTISIIDMAKKYCSLFDDSESKVIFDISEDVTKIGYNPTVKIQLDTSKIEQLGWQAQTDFEEMIKRLVEYMKCL